MMIVQIILWTVFLLIHTGFLIYFDIFKEDEIKSIKELIWIICCIVVIYIITMVG